MYYITSIILSAVSCKPANSSTESIKYKSFFLTEAALIKLFCMCYIVNAFDSSVVDLAPSVLAHNNFSLFLTPVKIECINFTSLP